MGPSNYSYLSLGSIINHNNIYIYIASNAVSTLATTFRNGIMHIMGLGTHNTLGIPLLQSGSFGGIPRYFPCIYATLACSTCLIIISILASKYTTYVYVVLCDGC